MKRTKLFISCAVATVFMFSFSGCSFVEISESNSTIDSVTYSPVPSVESTVDVDLAENTIDSALYDDLQNLYLKINANMSYLEMIDTVKSTNLPYSEEKYNGSRTIQVAFTDGCTSQKYKEEDGDYLEITYDYPKNENSSNDDLSKYSLSSCVYVSENSSLELISLVEGYYFSFSEPGNYISNLGSKLDLDKDMSKEEQLDYFFKHK